MTLVDSSGVLWINSASLELGLMENVEIIWGSCCEENGYFIDDSADEERGLRLATEVLGNWIFSLVPKVRFWYRKKRHFMLADMLGGSRVATANL